jgi:phosphatidylinositol glycan class A protein
VHGGSGHYTIAMVCDFFFPRLGGVEVHIWSVAHCLIQRGHKVIVCTHAYGDRQGVRYMSHGLKVYYLPVVPFTEAVAFPTFCAWLPLFRNIIIREGVTIVHGHQATSCMANEAIIMARALGIRACYTDHSLFGLDYSDIGSLAINTVLRCTLADVDAVIAVSDVCSDNLAKRTGVASKCYTIPNAIDPSRFQPALRSDRSVARFVIVVITRLVYRKGADLLADIIPEICARHPEVDFVIGGDGPKKRIIESKIKQHSLEGRVRLLGQVPHDRVREVLIQGHLFLNCSLTESFCIAIVEVRASPQFLFTRVIVNGVLRISFRRHRAVCLL